MLKIIEKIPTPEEYNFLTNSVGWGTRDNKIVEEALENSLYCVCIYDDNNIIGFGRIIGDKTIFLYIQDIIVLPKYQSQKIGTKIMNIIIDKINELKEVNPYIRTYLGASKNKENFYKKFGFKSRSDANLGDGMVLF